MKDILYSKGKNDECYTPLYAVYPLIDIVCNYAKNNKRKKKDVIIWCPFDKEDSAFVKLFKLHGFTVLYSHIDHGFDFFKYEPYRWDLIISNPPFTNKRKFFERALDLISENHNSAFAFLMTLSCLNDKYPLWSFYERNIQPQLLKFDKRIEYQNTRGNNKITFQSGYIGANLMKHDFILKELEKL